MNEPRIGELVERLRLREQAAIEQFVNEYREPLLRHIRIEIVRSNLPNRAAGTNAFDSCYESVFNGTFQKFLNRLQNGGPFRAEDSQAVLGYLKQIATNLIRDKERLLARNEVPLTDEWSDHGDFKTETVADSAELLEHPALTDTERRALKWRCEGRTSEEWAVANGGTAASYRAILQRAVAKLKVLSLRRGN